MAVAPHFPTVEDKVYIYSKFGSRAHPVTGLPDFHRGTDYTPYDGNSGLPIYAVMDGIIREKNYHSERGNNIVIEHTGDSFTSVYMHLQSFASSSHVGATVRKGQIIGYMGNTGLTSGTHLHLGICTSYPEQWEQNGPGNYIDAEGYLEGYIYDPEDPISPGQKSKGLGIVFMGKPKIYI